MASSTIFVRVVIWISYQRATQRYIIIRCRDSQTSERCYLSALVKLIIWTNDKVLANPSRFQMWLMHIMHTRIYRVHVN